MKFGLMYEIEMPKPWREGQEYEKYWQVMAQIEYAEEMGFDYTWAVEHHCLEEFSHCSAPEILFAAASQRTSKMRFGHGAVLLPQPYNHPIRVAERIGALDILSRGRLDVGFARSTTLTEMGAFGIDPKDTRPMMDEAIRVIPQLMMTERFPGYRGKYFSVGENRNIIPKPIQKPHPPLWMACSSPASFELAASYGVGVLNFNVARAETLEERIHNYRRAVQNPTDPISSVVNNQIATFMMVLCGERNDETIELAGEGMHWYMSLLRGQAGPRFLPRWKATVMLRCGLPRLFSLAPVMTSVWPEKSWPPNAWWKRGFSVLAIPTPAFGFWSGLPPWGWIWFFASWKWGGFPMKRPWNPSGSWVNM